ncbi:Essential protein involved in intracellular protein transport [Colletotrichum sp. SAR 10_98]|nr:Essential protein involved in intracellular protein transport [Colletotrichum sp. SAR 10_98]
MKKAKSIIAQQLPSFAEAARLAAKIDKTGDRQDPDKAKTDALEKRIKTRDTKINDLQEQLSSKTLQLKTKDKTINDLEGKIKEKETTIHDLENKIKDMNAMDRIHGSDTENGVEDLRRKIKSRTQDLQLATDTIDLLEGMVDVYARQAIEFIGHTIKAAPGPEHGWSFVMCNDGLIYLPSPTAQALTSMLNELLSPSNLRLLPFKPLLEAANLSDLRQNQPVVKCHMAEDGSVKPQQGTLDDAFKPFRDSWMEQEKFDIEKGRASVIKIGALFKIAQRRAEIRTDVDVDNTFLPVMLADEQEIASMVRQTTFEEVVRLLEIGDTVFPGSSKHRKHVRNDVPNQEIKRKKRRFSNS